MCVACVHAGMCTCMRTCVRANFNMQNYNTAVVFAKEIRAIPHLKLCWVEPPLEQVETVIFAMSIRKQRTTQKTTQPSKPK